MFTLEEGELLARMLRVLGWLALCVLAGTAYYVLRHFHLGPHLVQAASPGSSLAAAGILHLKSAAAH